MFPSLWWVALCSFTLTRCVTIEARMCPEWWLLWFPLHIFAIFWEYSLSPALSFRSGTKPVSFSGITGTDVLVNKKYSNFCFCLIWKEGGRGTLIRVTSQCWRGCGKQEGVSELLSALYHPYDVGGSLILTAVCREEFLAILTCSYLSLLVAWFLNMEIRSF